jgi:hypothetical protein
MDNKTVDIKKIKKIILLRRAESFFAPYFERIDIDYGSDVIPDEKVNEPVLVGKLNYKGDKLIVVIPADKRLKRLKRLLEKLEPAVLGGKVKFYDVVLLIWSVYAPIKALHKYRTKIRRITGLAQKEPKLQKFIIWKRIMSGKKER